MKQFFGKMERCVRKDAFDHLDEFVSCQPEPQTSTFQNYIISVKNDSQVPKSIHVEKIDGVIQMITFTLTESL